MRKLQECWVMLSNVEKICRNLVDDVLGKTDQIRDVVAEVNLRKEIMNLELQEFIQEFKLFIENFQHVLSCDAQDSENVNT